MAKKILTLIAFIVISIGFYILMDVLYTKIFTDSSFNFEWGADVIYPGVIATAMGLFVVFGGRKDEKSYSKKKKDTDKQNDK